MFARKIKKGIVALAFLPFLLLAGLGGAWATSVDVISLYYGDNSGRSVWYAFSGGTVDGNRIQLPASYDTNNRFNRGSGESDDTAYFWGDASSVMPGLPGVTLTPGAARATLGPAASSTEGVAVLYAAGTTIPPTSGTAIWSYTLDLANFNVDLTAAKAYQFEAGLGNPMQSLYQGSVEITWVKGAYNGMTYTDNTLIVQAFVRNGETPFWQSLPVVRTGLTPGATTISLQLSVSGGNTFNAVAVINGQSSSLRDGSNNPGILATGQFLRFPDLFPYVNLREEAQQAVDPFNIFSSHEQWSGNYNVGLSVADPGQALYAAVSVQSTNRGSSEAGYLAPTDLVHNGAMWNLPVALTLSTGSWPGFFPAYRFVATGKLSANDATRDKSVTGYVTEFVTITAPGPVSGAEVSTAPTISWTWPGATPPSLYGIFVDDLTAGGSQVWSNFAIPSSQPSVTYGGPLVNGHTYRYTITASIANNGSMNQSMVQGSFTYTGASTVIAFSNSVKDVTGYPGTPVPLANVQVIGTPALSTTTDTNGNFRIDGIPASTPFSLMITKPGGYYLPTYSAFFNWNADITGILPYALYGTGDYGAYVPPADQPTHGLIVGRVTQLNSPTAYLSGAVVTAAEWNPSTQATTGVTYPVYYDFAGGTSTGSQGLFYAKVPAGAFGTGTPKVVKLSVAPLSGYTFTYTDAWLPVYIGGVSQESFFATPGGATVSFSGVVQTYENETLYSGATVAQLGAESTVSTTTDANGAFTLTGLPADTEFTVKITGTGFVPTYTRVITAATGVVADRNYNLFTQARLTSWVVNPGEGLIRGRVLNSNNPSAGYVSGATVTYSSQYGRTNYVVKYEDQSGNLVTGGGTKANGKYYIFGVADGDTVTVTATHPYYTFPLLTDPLARKFRTFDASVSEAILKGTPAAGRVAIGGFVKDPNGNAIKGATVEQVGASSPINATVSNGDGAFYLTVPQSTAFYLKFSKPQATPTPPAPTYTAEMTFGANALAIGDFNLFPTSKLGSGTGNWDLTPGKGIIRGRVKDNAGNNLGGAVVSFVSSGSFPYTVCYDDACSSTNATGGSTPATGDNAGRYLIKNVEPTDTVTVTAAKEGFTFNSRIFHAYGDALHQGGPMGTPADESAIRNNFTAMLAEYNKGAAGSIDTVMGYFSEAFLDNGDNKAARRADMLSGMTSGETRTALNVTVTLGGDGLTAVMVVNWADGAVETLYWAKEAGNVWRIKGNQARHDAGVQSQHWSDGYHASFYVRDTKPAPALTSVTVTGPGISGSLSLTHDAFSGNWYPMSGTPFLGTTTPAGAQTYTITVTEGGTDYPYTRTISGYVTEFAAPSAPFNSFGSPVIFSWRGIPGASSYRVELSNDQGQRIWNKNDIPLNDWGVAYDGLTPLESGKTYAYTIVSEIETGDGRNMSMAQGSFTYSGSAQPTVSYGSTILTLGGSPISGAQVELWDAPLASVTTTAENGAFALGNILASVPFHLKFSATGYVPTYTAYMNFSANFTDTVGFYNLFTQSEFDSMSVEAGKGVIRGRVRDASRNNLAGATVTVWGALGNTYEVRYYDDMLTTYRTTGGTYPSGRFAVMNVVEGDRVVVNAQLDGFTFPNPRVFATHGGAVIQGGPGASNSCSYTLNPASTLVAAGGNGAGSSFGIATNAACTWTAVSNNASWLHVTGVSTGAGSGSIGYTVDANPGSARTGTITAGGKTFTVNQMGVGEATPYLGVWGAMTLNRENNDNWYTETTRITFNADGTGTAAGKKNDGSNAPGSRIADFTESFTYTALLNGDGSYSLTLNFSGDISAIRLVFSDNGNVALIDGTTSGSFIKFSTLVRLDGNNSHGNADATGPYYHVGYERNIAGIVDPPNGNGAYMSISGSHQFSGTGTYTYTAEANSLYLDGHPGFWVDNQASVDRNYNIAPDGLFTTSSGAGRGYFTGDGLVGVGAGSFASDNWVGYLFLKQADRSYSRADLTGTWAVSSFGDKKEISSQYFSSDFGTMTCPETGACTVSFKTRVNGGIDYNIFALDLTVDSLGGFGPGPGASGAQVGAIGNDGKTLIINPGILNPSDPSKRRIAAGVKATGTTNLSGGKSFDVYAGTLHQGGSYYAFLNVPDAGHAINAVQVEYNGSAYNAQYESADGAWFLGNSLNLGTLPPANARLEISIQDGASGPWYRYERTINGGVADFVSAVLPTGTITPGAFAFSFNGIPGGQKYFVHLFDATHASMLWHSDRTASLTNIPYTGSALTPGTTYSYEVVAQIGANLSMVTGQFTYGSSSGITVSGKVREVNGNPIASAVTVSVVGTGITATADGTTGVFSLPGVTAGTPFVLKFSATGYLDLYTPSITATADINLNQTATGSNFFILYTQTDLAGRSSIWTSGGLLVGRVVDQTYRYSSMVGGAFVTARGAAKDYPVYYDHPLSGPLRGGTTFYNGVYYVPNVDDGDTVTLTASRNGWTFPAPVVTTVHAGAVHVARIGGQEPGLFTLSGTVTDMDGNPVVGATLSLQGDAGKSTTSGAGGAYTLSGLPVDSHFTVNVGADGFAMHHAGPINLTGSLSGVGITLFTPAQLFAQMVVTGGNGLAVGKVIDASLTPLSGATVTLQSRSGTAYTPLYPGGSGSTSATGEFALANIQAGDVVKVQAVKNGYAFAPVYLEGYGGESSGRLVLGNASPVAYNSYVVDKNSAGLAGVLIEQVGASPANTATSSASPAGNYTLNVPPGVPFYLRFSKTGSIPTLTAEMTVNGPVNEVIGNAFTLFTTADYGSANWASASGKGTIRTRVRDAAGNSIAGATVLYTSRLGNSYTLCYDDACTPGLTVTQSNGRYLLKNVEPGDTVTVTARKAGSTFNTRVYHVEADTVHQGAVQGTELFSLWTGSSHYAWDNNYYGKFAVNDPGHAVTSVAVTGTGITGTLNLTYVPAAGQWWEAASSVNYGATAPTNATYQIAVTTAAGTNTYSRTISGSVASFATTLAPTGTVGVTPTFTFTGIADATYSVNLFDASWNFLWSSPVGPSTTIPYTGPALANGTYNYQVLCWINGNNSIASGQFNYVQGIPFTAMVYNVNSGAGLQTYLDVTIGSGYAGTLPEAITTLNVFGPSGTLIADRSSFTYYSTWTEFLAKLSGSPAAGAYTFEVSDGILSTTLTDSFDTLRTIPVADTAGIHFTYSAGTGTTFTWGAVSVTGFTPYYRLIIEDMSGNRIWSSSRVQTLSVTVPDGVLDPNQTYRYTLRVEDALGGSLQNQSRSDYVTFRINPISYGGYVMDSQATAQPVSGATVEQGGVPTNGTATDGSGHYTLGNLTAGAPFYLHIYKGTSFAHTYSADMTFTDNREEVIGRAFTLFPSTQLLSWGVTSGKGVIRNRVYDRLDNYIGGAVVTATGQLQATYPVCYDDACTGTLTSTQSSTGRYVIKNVLNNDTVTVTATKDGWTFNTRIFHTFADGISLGRITASGPVSLTVTVNDGYPNWAPLSNAKVSVVGFPDVAATTGSNGSATISGLPPGIDIPFTVAKEGFVSGYGNFSRSSGVSAWTVPLLTQATLNGWGIASGKGVIYGRIIDDANPDNSTNALTGAQVRYESSQGKIYDVVYLNNDFTLAAAATATNASGRYAILNVSPEDTVTVSARKDDWSFWSRTVKGYADGVTYAFVYGTAGGATVSMYVKDKDGAAIQGAMVRVAENTALAAATDTYGAVTLTGLPLDTPITFEVIKSGYRNTYSRHVTLTGNNSNWGTYNLFAASDTTSFGGIPADKGVILGFVKSDKDSSNLSGAVVSYTSVAGNTYPVVYLNDNYTVDATAAATKSNGRFAILNVTPGDTVVARAHLAGWVFEPRAYTARANSVNQSGIYGIQAKYRAEAWSGSHIQQPIHPNSYWVGLQVPDEAEAIQSVVVTGPGGNLSGAVNPAAVFTLVWNASEKTWSYWNETTGTSNGPQFYGTKPSVPLHYTFIVTEKANPSAPIILTASVDAFVDNTFGTPVSPAGGATVQGNPSFTWTGTIPAEYTYGVELSGPGGFFWNSGPLPSTAHSVAYSGAALTPGSYVWRLMVWDMFGNFSMVIPDAFTVEAGVLKGDLNGDTAVTLADAVIAMKVLSGLNVTGALRSDYAASGTDVSGDNKVGLEELFYILQKVSGER